MPYTPKQEAIFEMRCACIHFFNLDDMDGYCKFKGTFGVKKVKCSTYQEDPSNCLDFEEFKGDYYNEA